MMRHIRLNYLLSICLIALNGCTTTVSQTDEHGLNAYDSVMLNDSLAHANSCCNKYDDIDYQPLKTGKIVIDEKSPAESPLIS